MGPAALLENSVKTCRLRAGALRMDFQERRSATYEL